MTGMTRRDVTLAGMAALALPLVGRAAAQAGAQGEVQGGGARDPLWFVDPELRPAALRMREMEKTFPGFSDATLAQARKGMAAFDAAAVGSVPVARRVVPGGRIPDVIVYVINAKPGRARAGILHTHGGGYIVGTAGGNARDLHDLAAALDCTIVSVEYRLAPETRYAGSIEDNYTALRWLHVNAAELGIDRARIGVMGASAGGGHAALLALAARDRGEVPLAFQSLIYPMLDDRTGSTRAVPTPIGTLTWTAASNHYGWRSFLGQEPGGASVPAAAVPARRSDLAGLPPAWIGVGAIDLFVGEDIDYARRLIEAGVATELLVVPGAFHGFDGIAPETSVAKRFTAARNEALKRGLAARA